MYGGRSAGGSWVKGFSKDTCRDCHGHMVMSRLAAGQGRHARALSDVVVAVPHDSDYKLQAGPNVRACMG